MRQVGCARDDRVSLVKFLIIQKEFRLVQSRWENVGGALEFIALRLHARDGEPHDDSPAFQRWAIFELQLRHARRLRLATIEHALKVRFSNHKLNKSRGSKVERLVNLS